MAKDHQLIENQEALNRDFNKLADDFKLLSQNLSKDYGRDLNRAFQRLIYLLTDTNRLKVMMSCPSIVTKKYGSGKMCIKHAQASMTEK